MCKYFQGKLRTRIRNLDLTSLGYKSCVIIDVLLLGQRFPRALEVAEFMPYRIGHNGGGRFERALIYQSSNFRFKI